MSGAGAKRQGLGQVSRSCGKLVGMPMTVHVPDDLGGRLVAEAARLGTSVDELSAQLLAAGLPNEDPLEAFIGSWDSGDPAWASRDIHELRAELASRRANNAS